MLLRPCPFCDKSIPRAMNVCPYCHRDEQGKSVQIDSTAPPAQDDSPRQLEQDLAELASEDSYVKDQAMIRLAHRGYGVVQGLIAVLSDLGKPGLAGVAKALGRIGDRRALGVLKQAAHGGDDEVRMASVWALSQFHDSEVLPALIAEADRPDPTVQGYLAYALGNFRDAQALPVLLRLLRHSNREVAFHAACALGESGDKSAVKPLRKALVRRDPLVRAAATAALKKLGASAVPLNSYWVYGVWAVAVGGVLWILWMWR